MNFSVCTNMPPEPQHGSYTRPLDGSSTSTITLTTLGGVKNSPPRFPSARAKLPRKYS
ncbi:Uncharacterised protein [Mycobacterium tuberculosis]|nr:Uncharacterised protein [Mycobacterium tuberculosis]